MSWWQILLAVYAALTLIYSFYVIRRSQIIAEFLEDNRPNKWLARGLVIFIVVSIFVLVFFGYWIPGLREYLRQRRVRHG